MKLSVIVVNHNRCDLLKLAVNSLIKSGNTIDYELIIIDNASTDNSIGMVRTDYPNIRLVANTINEGVAKANNQGIEVSKGEYILLVNADTICGKETLNKVIEFMDVHTDAGGLGVRMLDARGSF